MSTLTRQQVMELEQVSESTVRRWERNGLRHQRKGNVIRHKQEWIDEFMGRETPQAEEATTPAMKQRIANMNKALAKL